jgi:hypothetical protein
MNGPTVYLQYGMEKDSGTTKFYKLGQRAMLPDGRVFRYALANGAIGAGQLCQMKATLVDFDMDLVCEATVAGANSISVVTGSTHPAIGTDEFEDGYIHINDGAGEGHIYRIRSHTSVAADSSTVMAFSLELDDRVDEALVNATSLAGLVENPYKDVVLVDPDTAQTMPLGAAPAEISDNEYFWLQTFGLASVRIEGGTAVPVVARSVVAAVSTSDGLSGSVEAATTAHVPDNDQPQIGISVGIASVDGDYGLIFLTLAP